MTNLAAAWTNIALNATVTVSSAATAMPASNLQQEDTRRSWRSGATTTANVDLTFSSTQSADTFALFNTNLTAAGIVRVQLSNTALGNTDIWDSNAGSTPGTVDPNYKDAIVLASSVKSGWKYCRFVVTDTSLTYIEAGLAFAATRTAFAYNYDWGAQFTRVDPSIQKKTKGGQTKILRRPQFRRFELPIAVVTEAQRWSVVEQIDLLNGVSIPVLFILDDSSSNLGRDSIFGLIQESSPVALIQGFDSAGGIVSSKPYRVEQRL